MKTIKLLCLSAIAFTLIGHLLQAAPPSTAFTYQGRLFDGGVPANGLYDLQFTNFDAATAGNALGGFNINAVPVSNGLFTVSLDFGPVFDGTPRWLEISERTNGTGAFATLAPRQLLAAAPYATYAASAGAASTVAGLTILQNASGAPSVIAGSMGNYVASGAVGAVISGGGATNYHGFFYSNSVAADFGTVSGGAQNTVSAAGYVAAIGGGLFNTASAEAATLAGGYGNTASGAFAAMGGGDYNAAWSYATVVGGGELNTASDAYATVGGGQHNLSGAVSATIGGGATNAASGDYATVDGGSGNTADGVWATVGGGETNTANGEWATVAGGSGNTIQTGAGNTTIGGGFQNTIQTNASGATISGGNYNTIQTEAYLATIGGGNRNLVQTKAYLAAIGGGPDNTIQANAQYAVISGGAGNTVQADAFGAAIGGGSSNTVNAYYGTTPGGFLNTVQANAPMAAIGGGFGNTVQSNAWCAAIPGGYGNTAASQAFAAGNQAQAIHTGAFVWADSTAADFSSTANDQFAVRASGGVFFQISRGNVAIQADDTSAANDAKQLVILGNTDPSRQLELGYNTADNGNYGTIQAIEQHAGTRPLALQPLGGAVGINKVNPATALDVNGTVTATAFNPSSDRNLKEHLGAVNPREILDQVAGLPIWRWNFKADAATPHLGPMAQDFYAAFNVGSDDRHIATVDADGVALAAIQGLNQKLEETRADNAALEKALAARNAEIQALQRRLEAIEKRLAP